MAHARQNQTKMAELPDGTEFGAKHSNFCSKLGGRVIMEAMVTERSNYVFTHRFSGNGFFLGLKKRDFSSLKTINPSLLSHSKVLQENSPASSDFSTGR